MTFKSYWLNLAYSFSHSFFISFDSVGLLLGKVPEILILMSHKNL